VLAQGEIDPKGDRRALFLLRLSSIRASAVVLALTRATERREVCV